MDGLFKTLCTAAGTVALLLTASCHNGLESGASGPLGDFAYRGGGPIIVSGHRGGLEKGYPENSIEGFERVLYQMPAFFEIDPRLTKDGKAVLMHDATLDRTSTAKGRLSARTFKELEGIRLKDCFGNATNSKIPLLEDVIIWSKGRTVVNLDKKDVPMDMVIELIKKHNASDSVMLTVHTGAQARYYYERLPEIKFSVFARNKKEYEDIAISGVPWDRMIAYVGSTIDDKNREIVEKLRSHGVKCMVSFAPTADKLKTKEERQKRYAEEIARNPDIIESDYPVDVWEVLKKMNRAAVAK